MAEGLSYSRAGQKLLREARGSEAPASAMVRMAERREIAKVTQLNQDLAKPVASEPLSAAITALIRALDEQLSDADLRVNARAVHHALLPSASL